MANSSFQSGGRTTQAEQVALALGGRKIGRGWSARCPIHDDRRPSLSLHEGHDGKVLLHCHAGCPPGEIIAHLKANGLWSQNGSRQSRLATSNRVFKPTEQDRDEVKRAAAALSIWQAGKPAGGTLIETYFKSRGLRLPATLRLRFHPRLRHPSGESWPAMIAQVTRGSDDTPLGIHRTFLARNGAGKAPVTPQKMMLGPCRGGAVRLAEPSDVLMVGEGIETCLAAMQETDYPAWAALSTSGMRSLDLPRGVRDVIVLADGDDAGEAAAKDCALRWKREGRRVRIARAPKGLDFNDMVAGRTFSVEENAQ